MAQIEDVVGQAADPRQGTGTAGNANADPLTQGLYGSAANHQGAGYGSANTIQEAIKSRMPDLVKGAGMAHKGGNMPLTNYSDIMTRSAQAAMDIRTETAKGFRSKRQVVSELNGRWLDDYGAFKTALTMPTVMEQVQDLVSYLPGGGDAVKQYIGKSFTAGNLGIGSVSS